MCGIFGIFLKSTRSLEDKKCRKIIEKLFLLSRSRGGEASGIAVKNGSAIYVEKSATSPAAFIKSKVYKDIFDKLKKDSIKENTARIFIGHSRLVTNGSQCNNLNNQPVESSDVVCVHNGIIVNDQDIWRTLPGITKKSELDTEALTEFVNLGVSEEKDVVAHLHDVFSVIEGSASIAVMNKKKDELYLATNTGSLYFIDCPHQDILLFASEERFLKEIITSFPFLSTQDQNIKVQPLAAGNGIKVDSTGFSTFAVPLSVPLKNKNNVTIYSSRNLPSLNLTMDGVKELHRCTKCILPATVPFIRFDENGVCSYCHHYKKYTNTSLQDLENKFKSGVRNDKQRHDCLVAFSGGRDSCYSLHVLKKELNLNPIAMTYDWGVVTDLARRNQAKMCGTLGIELVIVSADIAKKRANIRKNLLAWLKKPELGMIPLLMAGDKPFFYYSKKIAKANNIDRIVFGVNPLEKTDFKSGFAGVNQGKEVVFHNTPLWENAKLVSYYMRNFLQEPAYLNSSLVDTAFSYFISYFGSHPYLELYDYVRWDEGIINDTLMNEYNWEVDPTTTTTWRIGDGTAALYNYVYFHVAGFTENDSLRSNQIREGIINRDQALALVSLENQPRYASIQEYLALVGVDFESTLATINALKKLY